jgi:hypothetical protein
LLWLAFCVSNLLKYLGLGGKESGPDSAPVLRDEDEDITLPTQEETDQHFKKDKGKRKKVRFAPEEARTYPKTKPMPFDNRKALFGAELEPITSSSSSSTIDYNLNNLYQLSNADLVNKADVLREEALNIKDQFNLLSLDQKIENISSFQSRVENIENKILILDAEFNRRENINTSDWDVRAREEEDNLIKSPILTSVREPVDEDDVLTPRPSFSQVLSEDTLLFGSIPDLSLNNYKTEDNFTLPGEWPGSPLHVPPFLPNLTEPENTPLPNTDDSDIEAKI